MPEKSKIAHINMNILIEVFSKGYEMGTLDSLDGIHIRSNEVKQRFEAQLCSLFSDILGQDYREIGPLHEAPKE
ncbi:hypothetical protein [Pseudoalteromonas sp. T1lg23B]|uniref:hypothetical protein n=1 Tax=Pseudoalteromonas sp. T1lg23B TaxID=2077097 RepID=UPI000CF65EBB|nr:hypothetical protein [Pseudoalteromonas sp. T1lg23B]